MNHKHWAYKYANQIVSNKQKKEYLVESGITPSGTVHAGNFREVMTQELVKVAFEDLGFNAKHQYIWDNYDRFRKVPKNVPDEWEQHIGKPVSKTPDPWGCHDSYSEHFEKPFIDEIKAVGIEPEFLSMTEEYEKCIFAEKIKTVLEKKEETVSFLNKFRKEDHPEGWLPLKLYCEKCGKDTTTQQYLGDYKINYTCKCGNENTIDFRKKGIVKLSWRVDWPMRWSYYDVDFESSGKDHQSAGGSVDTGKLISKKIFNHQPPIMPMYDFINIKGETTKMSSSKGNVVTVGTLLKVYEPEIVRYLYTGKHKKPLDISFDLDLTNTYNYFDKAEKAYYEGSDDKNEIEKFKLSQLKDSKYVEPLQFLTAANIIQAANGDMNHATKTMEKLELPLNKRSENRLQLAWNWVQNYAPEIIKFTISEELPEVDLSDIEKEIFSEAADLVKQGKPGPEIQQFIYNKSKEHNLKLKNVFKHAYQLLLNKNQGPRLGNFLAVLDTNFTVNRLKLRE